MVTDKLSVNNPVEARYAEMELNHWQLVMKNAELHIKKAQETLRKLNICKKIYMEFKANG